ncbi:hypothetical protein GCM10010530_02640 [Kribbella aluminosa]
MSLDVAAADMPVDGVRTIIHRAQDLARPGFPVEVGGDLARSAVGSTGGLLMLASHLFKVPAYTTCTVVIALLGLLALGLGIVPAVLRLFGERAWWLPRSLDRVLPRIKLEDHS